MPDIGPCRYPLNARLARATGVLVVLLTGVGCAPAVARSSGPPRAQPINLVVIHTTGGPTCDPKSGRPIWVRAGTLAANMRFIEAHPKLGIHYMIDRDGTLRRSVPEDQVAHHVFGHSPRSIAIELINDGDGLDPFPEAQLSAVAALIHDITRRRGLPRHAVKRHSDLDPSLMPCDSTRRRKVDPGPAFPFEAVLDAAFAEQRGRSGAGPNLPPRPQRNALHPQQAGPDPDRSSSR